MQQFVFEILDNKVHLRTTVNRLINRLNGDYTITETKDGGVYNVTFENDIEGQEFKSELIKILPDSLI